LLLLAVSTATIRSSLVPLRELSAQAESIGPAASDVRLPEADVPRELLPLVRAINRAFDRLEDGFRAQREFTADAAHELRTPLAVLGAHIDTLPCRDSAVALRKDLDGMARLVGQLLRVAQVESLAIATDQKADLAVIATDVASWLAPMAIKDGRSIEVAAPSEPVQVHGNGEAIFHAVRNLAENALAHTPRGTAVTIAVDTATATISVRDHGPGVPAAQRERIFQRFARLSRGGAGAGLGLAIVKRTMETHGGTVSVADADGGGALFALSFPTGG
jgi:signal transduction histidine kinase